MGLYNMIGYKLYKENEDGSIHMMRIVNMHRPFKITESTKEPAEITVLDYDDNETKKIRTDSLKEYHPIKPDGVFTISIVNVIDGKGKICKDVIATGTKYLDLELGLAITPYCVCRQNITDIFYNLLTTDEDHTLVGLAINKDTCPSNFDMPIMFAANDVVFNEFINFYRNDTLEDILTMVKISKYDDVLRDLYNRHIKAVNKPEFSFKNEHGGWCRDLNTLLTQNNFQADLNQMLGITEVGFDISDYLEDRKIPNSEDIYKVAKDDFRYWLSSLYKVNMKEVNFLEYDHDINLADFNNSSYLLIRDTTKKLYLAVYLVDGEYFEEDLKQKAKELDFTTKFKMAYMARKSAE